MKALLITLTFCVSLTASAQTPYMGNVTDKDLVTSNILCIERLQGGQIVYTDKDTVYMKKIPGKDNVYTVGEIPAGVMGTGVKHCFQDTLPVLKNQAPSFVHTPMKGEVDTIHVKDTVLVPVYDTYDTSKKALLQVSMFGFTRVRKGYMVLRGFAYVQHGKFVWNEEPKLHAFLNRKKKPIKKVIQIL